MKKHVTRKLRQDLTPWERKLWASLRNRATGNIKFRRQLKIGRFVVDFFSPNRKLIIELDGGHHNDRKSNILDIRRQKYLESLGYRVMRFWNNEIDTNLDGVIQRILQDS